jgi:2-(1,2-epoxy-1,2-dihydrophenyl)acetyl-CoA isomerase
VNQERPDLLRRLEKGVLWITLNRPEAGNAMKPSMRDQIADWLDGASADLEVRCVVITATGERHFCTGADLRGDRAAPSKPEGAPERALGDTARFIRNGWQRLIGSIQDCEKPVIAAVNGTAAGGGSHLALACDLVMASDSAKFIEVFVRRGIAPDAGGAYLLTRLVGPQRAKEMFFFGDDVKAEEALSIGLVNRVVPASQLQTEATEWAERLASGPTKAIGMAKMLANRAIDTDRAAAFWDEAYAQELVSRTEDSQEGLSAFVERRDAKFKGW